MDIGKRDAKNKQKERDRSRKRIRKYGQAKLKHSRMGIYSCVYAGLSFAILQSCILIAFVMRGETFGFIGGVGILSIILAAVGIRAGVKGMREREKRYITCKAGIAANIVILLGLILIFIGGVL
ncbi:DUF6142 family protein [Clostridium sp. C105KSO13]|uniref:DUF6142 family protein n=1 Tax=Clostridium sp. C105KSO13 TaxID=1776045 RepID=UPI0007408668|nr:DUF6142 family protein [Clostridium sp. C105KSO13]CUX45389.1 hypothetical protein BN3456_02503 [Clostridium sp. C105KSO13]